MTKTDVDKARGNSVTRKNELVRTIYQPMNIMATRLLSLVFSRIKIDDKCMGTHEIHIKDYAAIFDVNPAQQYKNIVKVMKCYNDNALQFRFPGTKRVVWIPWFSKAEYDPDKCVLILKVNEELKPYFFKFKNDFTQYQIENIIKLRSAHALRLYEIMKCEQFKCKYAQVKKGEREKLVYIDYFDLRGELGIAEEKYKFAGNFAQAVIQESVKSINRHTDINVTYDIKKNMRKIVGFSFDITEGTSDATEEPSEEFFGGEHD